AALHSGKCEWRRVGHVHRHRKAKHIAIERNALVDVSDDEIRSEFGKCERHRCTHLSWCSQMPTSIHPARTGVGRGCFVTTPLGTLFRLPARAARGKPESLPRAPRHAERTDA